MRSLTIVTAASVIAFASMAAGPGDRQAPAVLTVDAAVLREYTGVFRWDDDKTFLYLQMWDEFSGFGKPAQLVAFEESGDVRAMYPTAADRFFTGPAAGVATSIESRIDFQPDKTSQPTILKWQRSGSPSRTARRVDTERSDSVRFSNGDIRLAGTLIRPLNEAKHPAIILVHGSGAENREYVLPFAHFLVRHGVAVLGYDKRGVGQSTGDWNTASYAELAGDVAAAFEYLKTRPDVDAAHIGLLGVSQAGWIMQMAAARIPDLAFLISISGAGVSPAETTLDQTQNELTASGMKPPMVAALVGLMKLQYEFARTGQGWDEYLAARQKLADQMGPPPDSFPGTPDHPYWQTIKRSYFYDPGPIIRQLQLPLLAIFGELDNNIVAEKNKRAWEAALKAGGNRDYTLVILPKANHLQFEAATGSNAEMPSLKRIVPSYYSTVANWLARRLPGFDGGTGKHY
jgi:pimeloyl-ACP methyl ester carboxylesterase